MMGFLVSVVSAVFFPGLILRTKSIASGRKGPGILQPWRNIRVLLRKGSVISPVTGWIFRTAPAVYLATILCAMVLLPFPGGGTFPGFEGDFVFFAYLLALGKFFFILGALDTGSSFEGMGANREAFYSLLAEPAFFILFGTLAMLTGHTSMQEIFGAFRFAGHSTYIAGAIAVYLLVQIAMIENSRMPVDDPKTHLELTMIHEVMILDHSGFDLALIQIGTTLKFCLYGMLIANFVVPAGMTLGNAEGGLSHILTFAGRAGICIVVQALFAGVIGLLESFRARKKMNRNPQFIVTLSSIALVGFFMALLFTFHMIAR